MNNDDSLILKDSDGIPRDYVCWGIAEPSGVTHDAAVLAQHWTSGTGFFVNTFDRVVGDSIGRNRNSDDSNSMLDWDITCGRDAIAPTPGTINAIVISLQEGWNLISLPLVQANQDPEVVLASIDGDWDRIKLYDSQSMNPWLSSSIYSPGLSEIDLLDHTMGIWIHMINATILVVEGAEPVSTNITLYAGWNLVGYPSFSPETVANALWGTGADWVEVCDLAEPCLIKEVESTYMMQPGEGYWIHVPADTIWTVDW